MRTLVYKYLTKLLIIKLVTFPGIQCRHIWKCARMNWDSLFLLLLSLLYFLGLERIHQVTNTIRIANTGWRIRICIREYSDSLNHSRILLTECASEEEVLFGKYMWVTLRRRLPLRHECVASMGATI